MENDTAASKGEIRIKTWFAWNILACVLCLPLGLAGIAYSVRAKRLAKVGEVAGARSAAKSARAFFIMAVVLGPLLALFYMTTALNGGF